MARLLRCIEWTSALLLELLDVESQLSNLLSLLHHTIIPYLAITLDLVVVQASISSGIERLRLISWRDFLLDPYKIRVVERVVLLAPVV